MVVLFGFVSVMAMMVFILLLIGAVYAMIIYLVVHFYRTMYTDEGYLLHTLPVTKNQILISKILVSSIWLLITYLAMAMSITFFIMFMAEAVSPGSIGEMMTYLPELFDDIGKALRDMTGSERLDLIHFLVSIFLLMLVGLPSAIVTIFGAISLGQLFSKHRVLMAILCYVGISIGMGLFSSIVRSIAYTGTLFFSVDQILGYFFTILDSALVMGILTLVGFYLLSYFITSKKLNME